MFEGTLVEALPGLKAASAYRLRICIHHPVAAVRPWACFPKPAVPLLRRRCPTRSRRTPSAVLRYRGPFFAVLLFARVAPDGVAWLRIASARLVFAVWRRPWRFFAGLPRREQGVVGDPLCLRPACHAPRATFALLLALLLATTTAVGFLVLRQVPAAAVLVGIALVIGGIALHRSQT